MLCGRGGGLEDAISGDIAMITELSEPLFNIAIENTGQIGQKSFELWLTVENNSKDDIAFSSGYVTLFYHYGNWVSGLPLQTETTLPSELAAGQRVRCRLHKGNSLPIAKVGHSGWMHGEKKLKGLEAYTSFHDLMNDGQLEIEAGFRFQMPRAKDSGPLKEPSASKRLSEQNPYRVLSVSSSLSKFQRVPFTAKSVERYDLSRRAPQKRGFSNDDPVPKGKDPSWTQKLMAKLRFFLSDF